MRDLLRRPVLRLGALCLSALLLSSCDELLADGGNRGAACQSAAYAKCERALTCNQTFTDPDLCAELIVRQCCEMAGTCDDTLSAEVSAQFDACTTALRSQACEDAMIAPDACMGLSPGL